MAIRSAKRFTAKAISSFSNLAETLERKVLSGEFVRSAKQKGGSDNEDFKKRGTVFVLSNPGGRHWFSRPGPNF
jgi:hypothetical protein